MREAFRQPWRGDPKRRRRCALPAHSKSRARRLSLGYHHRLRHPDSAPWMRPLMEVRWTETTALTPALSPRRGRNMRRHVAISSHHFSTGSGGLRLAPRGNSGPATKSPHEFRSDLMRISVESEIQVWFCDFGGRGSENVSTARRTLFAIFASHLNTTTPVQYPKASNPNSSAARPTFPFARDPIAAPPIKMQIINKIPITRGCRLNVMFTWVPVGNVENRPLIVGKKEFLPLTAR